jgi:hypothetical protein
VVVSLRMSPEERTTHLNDRDPATGQTALRSFCRAVMKWGPGVKAVIDPADEGAGASLRDGNGDLALDRVPGRQRVDHFAVK